MANAQLPLEGLVDQLVGVLPPELGKIHEQVKTNLRGVLQSHLQNLDLISRDEFDVQKAVLGKARLKVEELLERVNELEVRLQETDV